MLEEREHALARGARIYAELAGYGSTCDASTRPTPTRRRRPARAMRLALADAGIGPEDIGYVNAHATSTASGDLAESRALALAGLAAGGRVVHQVGARARPRRRGRPGGRRPLMAFARDACRRRSTSRIPSRVAVRPRHEAARGRVRAAISNSFGFGGHNASLVFPRHETV